VLPKKVKKAKIEEEDREDKELHGWTHPVDDDDNEDEFEGFFDKEEDE